MEFEFSHVLENNGSLILLAWMYHTHIQLLCHVCVLVHWNFELSHV